MRVFFTIIGACLIVFLSEIVVLANFWLGATVFLALNILFFGTGLKVIPADPPHKAVLVFWGRRLNTVLDEGVNWFPFYPLFSFILIKVVKINYDLPPQEVRTPDRAMISVQASITFVPGIDDRSDSYITYLNSGTEEGVMKIIRDVVEDRVKTWAGSNQEGPSSWLEALTLRDEVHSVLAKSLLGDALEKIESEIPTSTWMRFLADTQVEPTKYDLGFHNSSRDVWAEKDPATGAWNWDGLQGIFDKLYPSDAEKKDLREKIDRRRNDVRKLREGRATFGDESLGITIGRFTVNDIRVIGEVARAAELEEKERRERAADTQEIDNISDRVATLRKAHPDLTASEAFKLVQVERSKATRTIIDVSGAQTPVGNDLLGLAGVAKTIVEGLRAGKGSQGGQESQSGQGGQGGQMTPEEIEKAREAHKKARQENMERLKKLQQEKGKK